MTTPLARAATDPVLTIQDVADELAVTDRTVPNLIKCEAPEAVRLRRVIRIRSRAFHRCLRDGSPRRRRRKKASNNNALAVVRENAPCK